jgi:prophage tail gpP-like protein
VGLSDLAGALGISGASASEPTVRRPVAAVAFGEGGGGAAGTLGAALGGLAGAASTAAGALGIDSGGGDDPWARSLVSVVVDSGTAPSVDCAEIHLSAGDDAPDVAVGDRGTVALGFADAKPTTVFTGEIASVQRGARGVTRLVATNGGAALATLRFAASYKQRSAGDVVRDCADRVGVSVGSIDDGATLPFLAVDESRSAWRHLAALARSNGAIAFVSPDGKLTFRAAEKGDPAATFTFGIDVLSLRAAEDRPGMGAVTVVGDGAAGGHGTDAWGWLVKDPSSVTGHSGHGDPARMTIDGALRTSDAARSAAASISAMSALMDARGHIVVPGTTEVMVGATIAIASAPQYMLNGRFLVLRIRHSFSKRSGLLSRIEFSKVAAGSGGAAGGLLAVAQGFL